MKKDQGPLRVGMAATFQNPEYWQGLPTFCRIEMRRYEQVEDGYTEKLLVQPIRTIRKANLPSCWVEATDMVGLPSGYPKWFDPAVLIFAIALAGYAGWLGHQTLAEPSKCEILFRR